VLYEKRYYKRFVLYDYGRGASNWQTGYKVGTGTETKNPNNLELYIEGIGGAPTEVNYFDTKNKVNLSLYSTMIVEAEGDSGNNMDGGFRISINTVQGTQKDGNLFNPGNGDVSKQESIVDISSFNDNVFISFYVFQAITSTYTAKLYKLYFLP
jgi:hypothetical protein